jgi:hypothetical protein
VQDRLLRGGPQRCMHAPERRTVEAKADVEQHILGPWPCPAATLPATMLQVNIRVVNTALQDVKTYQNILAATVSWASRSHLTTEYCRAAHLCFHFCFCASYVLTPPCRVLPCTARRYPAAQAGRLCHLPPAAGCRTQRPGTHRCGCTACRLAATLAGPAVVSINGGRAICVSRMFRRDA